MAAKCAVCSILIKGAVTLSPLKEKLPVSMLYWICRRVCCCKVPVFCYRSFYLFVYLSNRLRVRGSPIAIDSLNVCDSERWVRCKPGSLGGISHGVWSPSTLIIIHCVPGHMSRKVDQKWSSQGMSPASLWDASTTVQSASLLHHHT